MQRHKQIVPTLWFYLSQFLGNKAANSSTLPSHSRNALNPAPRVLATLPWWAKTEAGRWGNWRCRACRCSRVRVLLRFDGCGIAAFLVQAVERASGGNKGLLAAQGGSHKGTLLVGGAPLAAFAKEAQPCNF
jgi:hypothetical protein